MNKRFLSIVLALTVILSTLTGIGTVAYAAIGIEHEAQVSKLNAFGILSGYPSADYKADAQVTARDFVIAAYKLSGAEVDATAEMAGKFGFNADDKSIGVINAAAVLLTALDLKTEAESSGGYPGGYRSTAAKYGLFDGIGISDDAKLTNDAMAVMLYNALDIELPEVRYSDDGVEVFLKGKRTALDNLKIYKGYGVVTGTQYAAMRDCSKAEREEILIDNDASYRLGKTYADELFGYNVEFYYNEKRELLWIDASDVTKVTRVAEADVIGIDAAGINFYNEKERKKKVSFDSPVFLHNGTTVQNPDLNSFVPESGYIVLIDNDNDGSAELVCCEDYGYVLVNGKNSDEQTVNDFETGSKVSLSTNDYDAVKISKGCTRIAFSDINDKDVLAVIRPDSSDGVLRVIVSERPAVTGSVTSVLTDGIKIDGTEYKISTAYRGAGISLDKSGTFYMDLNGNIVRFIEGKQNISQYAYLIAVANHYTDDDCQVMILTAGGTVEKRNIYYRVRHGGSVMTPTKLIKALSSGGSVERQLITYSLNSKGEINKLETANKNNLFSGMDEKSDEFSLYFRGRGRYRRNNLCFNSKYLINADTPIFVVPADRKNENYKVSYAQGLTNGTSYHISVYDIDEYMTAGAIVLDELDSEPEQLKAKRSILVDSVYTGLNDDNQSIVILEGYQQGSKVTLKSGEESSLADSEGRYYSIGTRSGYTPITRGDVIQVSLDTDGGLLAFRTLYKADEGKKNLVISSNDTPNEYEEGGNINEFSDLFILTGQVLSRSDSVLVVQSDTKRAHKITNGASVYVVKDKRIEKVTTGDIGLYDNVYLHTYQGNLQEVIIYR